MSFSYLLVGIYQITVPCFLQETQNQMGSVKNGRLRDFGDLTTKNRTKKKSCWQAEKRAGSLAVLKHRTGRARGCCSQQETWRLQAAALWSQISCGRQSGGCTVVCGALPCPGLCTCSWSRALGRVQPPSCLPPVAQNHSIACSLRNSCCEQPWPPPPPPIMFQDFRVSCPFLCLLVSYFVFWVCLGFFYLSKPAKIV